MRVAFMGTPDFAAASLKMLVEKNYNVVGVFTQPDKPKGRGMSVCFSPVKEIAVANGIPVFQPEKMRDGTALDMMTSLKPDVVVVVAYGRILPDELLAVPPLGTINVHGSLLPKYRGSAPIQWAVLNGERVTGVTTMYIATELDAGDIIFTAETEIGEKETSGDLFDRLKVMGADLLDKTLCAIADGSAPRTVQNHAEATFTRQLDKSLCPVDWSLGPRQALKQIYGLQPWPVATVQINDETFKVFEAEYTATDTAKAPGSIVSAGKAGIEFACAGGKTLMITELQAPGKKRMKAADYLLGHPIKVQ